MIILAIYLLALVTGLIGGFLGSLLGIGGGAFMVPILVLLGGLSVKVVAPASLMAIMGTSIGGLLHLYKKKLVHLYYSITLGVSAIIGAATGLELTEIAPENTLRILLASTLVLSGIGLLSREKLEERKKHRKPEKTEVRRLLLACIAAYLGGIIAVLLGVGGGVINVPIIVFLLGQPLHVAVATSKLIIGITATSGTIGNAVKSLIDLQIALPLLIGTYIGATVSSRILVKTPEKILRILASTYYYITATILVLEVIRNTTIH